MHNNKAGFIKDKASIAVFFAFRVGICQKPEKHAQYLQTM